MKTLKASYFNRGVKEEWWNAATHAVGAGCLFAVTIFSNSAHAKLLSAALGITLLFSMLYHGAVLIKKKEFYRRLDQASIFLSVGVTGGVYASAASSSYWLIPFLLSGVGILTYLFFYGELLDNLIVLLTNFLALVSVYIFCFESELHSPLSPMALHFFIGNIIYSCGVWFYVRDIRKWYHTIWHCFVLLGAGVHVSYFLI